MKACQLNLSVETSNCSGVNLSSMRRILSLQSVLETNSISGWSWLWMGQKESVFPILLKNGQPKDWWPHHLFFTRSNLRKRASVAMCLAYASKISAHLDGETGGINQRINVYGHIYHMLCLCLCICALMCLNIHCLCVSLAWNILFPAFLCSHENICWNCSILIHGRWEMNLLFCLNTQGEKGDFMAQWIKML